MKTEIKDLIQNTVSEMSSKLYVLLEDKMIEGLRLKGFEFKNRQDLIDFTKSRITCIDHIGLKVKVYSVDRVPFFQHNYQIELNNKNWFNGDYKIEANYGSFKYL
jgi:hypothetical protein